MDIVQFGDSSNHITDSWRWVVTSNFGKSQCVKGLFKLFELFMNNS